MGQQPTINEDYIYRNFGTQNYQNSLFEKFPELNKEQEVIERYIAQYKGDFTDEIITIPVVFHIVYSSKKQMLSEQDIQDQIDILNRYYDPNQQNKPSIKNKFRKKFSSNWADMNIQFCLADPDPEGLFIDPIEYISTENKDWDMDKDDIKFKKRGGAMAWNPNIYLNIWIGELANDISAYAQMPGGPTNTDGIVIDYNFFGTGNHTYKNYREGKTLIHAIGSYLGLFELWDEYVKCGDDKVDDTPIHDGPNHYFKDDNANHISFCKPCPTCKGSITEMNINFMDNTQDKGLMMFTHGQKKRVRAILSDKGPRAGLNNGKTICEEEIVNLPESTIDQSIVKFQNESDKHNNILQVPQITIYPNPTQEELNLLVQTPQRGKANIRVFNVNGKVMYSEHVEFFEGSNRLLLNCNTWNGMYFLEVKFEDAKASYQTFLVTNN